jgi:hypothetical protein
MLLRLFVLVAAVQQPIVASLLGAGQFATDPLSQFPTYIQPESWAFAIWGFIYAASIAFAVYQVIPRHDNQVLRTIRIPATIAFIGSSVWIYFAGSLTWTVWLTIPTLFVMAGALAYVVAQTPLADERAQLFSVSTLLPYAAWTGIAQWLNIVVLVNTFNYIQTGAAFTAFNVLMLIIIALYSLYWLKRANYTIWYGGVIIWASLGIVTANTGNPEGSVIIAIMAGALGLTAMVLIRQNAKA